MNNKKIATLAIFSALIIILQILSTYINIGAFPITLTLIPIIIAGAILGIKEASFLGFMFGLIVFIVVISGGDPNSLIMLTSNPVATITIIFSKGICCGLFSSYVYKKLENKNKKLAIILSSIVAPVTNTGIFLIGLILFFDSNITVFISTFLSFNFLIELITNVLIAPSLLTLIDRYKNSYN